MTGSKDFVAELAARIAAGEMTREDAEREIKRRNRGQGSQWWPWTAALWRALGGRPDL